MSVSPIGNLHFINQNSPVVSSTHANNQARMDMQNAMSLELANELKEEIAELRPTEETYKIDPKHQHEKQKNSQSQSEQTLQDTDKDTKDLLSDDEQDEKIYHLDIKI